MKKITLITEIYISGYQMSHEGDYFAWFTDEDEKNKSYTLLLWKISFTIHVLKNEEINRHEQRGLNFRLNFYF